MTSDLVRALCWVADDLERKGYSGSGVIRWAARELVTSDVSAPAEDGCRCCGVELVQPARGRRREWCPECAGACRRRQKCANKAA